jgi:hypothetical protein
MCISLITLITAIIAGTVSGVAVERYLAERGYKPTNYHAQWLQRHSPRVMTANW